MLRDPDVTFRWIINESCRLWEKRSPVIFHGWRCVGVKGTSETNVLVSFFCHFSFAFHFWLFCPPLHCFFRNFPTFLYRISSSATNYEFSHRKSALTPRLRYRNGLYLFHGFIFYCSRLSRLPVMFQEPVHSELRPQPYSVVGTQSVNHVDNVSVPWSGHRRTNFQRFSFLTVGLVSVKCVEERRDNKYCRPQPRKRTTPAQTYIRHGGNGRHTTASGPSMIDGGFEKKLHQCHFHFLSATTARVCEANMFGCEVRKKNEEDLILMVRESIVQNLPRATYGVCTNIKMMPKLSHSFAITNTSAPQYFLISVPSSLLTDVS